jgi:hypothetical protein
MPFMVNCNRLTLPVSSRNVAAYPPGRVHRAVPPKQNRKAALWPRLAARDQARRVSGHRPQDGRTGQALQPPRHDLTYPFPVIVETLVLLRSRSCIIDGEAEEDWGRERWR